MVDVNEDNNELKELNLTGALKYDICNNIKIIDTVAFTTKRQNLSFFQKRF